VTGVAFPPQFSLELLQRKHQRHLFDCGQPTDLTPDQLFEKAGNADFITRIFSVFQVSSRFFSQSSRMEIVVFRLCQSLCNL
jgi:hypothetical protein